MGIDLCDFGQDRVHLRLGECSESLRAVVARFAKGQSERGKGHFIGRIDDSDGCRIARASSILLSW
jgi:hypothetical protein